VASILPKQPQIIHRRCRTRRPRLNDIRICRRLSTPPLQPADAGQAAILRRGGSNIPANSPLEGSGFEPVWGFSCQVSFSFGAGSLFRAGKPFFVPSPAIRFAERAEGVKGPKR